jgi:hypothetical protein
MNNQQIYHNYIDTIIDIIDDIENDQHKNTPSHRAKQEEFGSLFDEYIDFCGTICDITNNAPDFNETNFDYDENV